MTVACLRAQDEKVRCELYRLLAWCRPLRLESTVHDSFGALSSRAAQSLVPTPGGEATQQPAYGARECQFAFSASIDLTTSMLLRTHGVGAKISGR